MPYNELLSVRPNGFHRSAGGIVMLLPVIGRRAMLGCAASLAFAQIAGALPAPLRKPAGKPILTVSGKIGQTNDGGVARFDTALLESLGTASFITSTPWYDHPVQFEGVRLDRIMQAVDAKGETVRATALDDYASELPVSDFTKFGTLLALKVGGQYVSVKDKGPCFIIYPFDRFPELANSKYYSRSVWQVATIDVF
jgi:hypothetical protein